MRNAGMLAAGLMSVWMLVGCGGTLEEAPAATEAGAEVEALYACPEGGSCPPSTQCVNGMCRNCERTPALCEQLAPSGSGATGDTQALARLPPDGPGPVIYPYCWNFNGTSCTSLNAKATCTDGIYFDYVCTCLSDWKFHCPEVR